MELPFWLYLEDREVPVPVVVAFEEEEEEEELGGIFRFLPA